MANLLCMARAYRDQPLRRYLTERNNRVGYLIDPSYADSGGIRGKFGVGFPLSCIFEFENSLYDRLLAAYVSGDSLELGKLWGQAKALDVPK